MGIAASGVPNQLGKIYHDTGTTFEFLGFEIDAIQVKVKLPVGKMENIQKQCQSLMHTENMTVYELAALIGKLVAVVRAVTPGPLHFRNLQMQKTKALLQNGMNYEALVTLTPECKAEVQWWAEELSTWNGNLFIKPCADMTLHLTTYASKKVWGQRAGTRPRRDNGPPERRRST